MINSVSLVGRLTKDIEKRVTPSNLSTCTFTLACDRPFVKDGNKKADFIQCVVWRQSADYLDRYARKGNVIALTGSIQTRTYDGKNGKVYVTEVVADRVAIIGTRSKDESRDTSNKYQDHRYEEDKALEEPTNVNLDISPDDLPFY